MTASSPATARAHDFAQDPRPQSIPGKAARGALAALCLVIPVCVAGAVAGQLAGDGYMQVRNLIRIGGLLAGYAMMVHYGERRALVEFGLKGALPEFGRGLLLGASLVAVAFAVMAGTGSFTVVGSNGGSRLAACLPLLAVMAVMEEVLLRLIVLRLLERWQGTGFALAASSALFGLMHLGGGQAHLFGALMLGAEGGLLFGGAYLLTRRVWLCLGLHLGWNVLEIGVCGADPLLASKYPGWLRTQLTGPAWITGGGSIQGSVIVFVLCVAVGSLLLYRARRRGSWKARRPRN